MAVKLSMSNSKEIVKQNEEIYVSTLKIIALQIIAEILS